MPITREDYERLKARQQKPAGGVITREDYARLSKRAQGPSPSVPNGNEGATDIPMAAMDYGEPRRAPLPRPPEGFDPVQAARQPAEAVMPRDTGDRTESFLAGVRNLPTQQPPEAARPFDPTAERGRAVSAARGEEQRRLAEFDGMASEAERLAVRLDGVDPTEARIRFRDASGRPRLDAALPYLDSVRTRAEQFAEKNAALVNAYRVGAATDRSSDLYARVLGEQQVAWMEEAANVLRQREADRGLGGRVETLLLDTAPGLPRQIAAVAAGSTFGGPLGGAAAASLMGAEADPENRLRGAALGAAGYAGGAVASRVLAPAGSGAARVIGAEVAGNVGVGAGLRAATGQPYTDADALMDVATGLGGAAPRVLGGLRGRRGPVPPATAQEASAAIQDAVRTGEATLPEVVSPGRAEAVADAQSVQEARQILDAKPAEVTPDGRIEAGYDPDAPRNGKVEPGAQGLVDQAIADGLQPVSSGGASPETGKPYVIARDPETGAGVRVEGAEPAPAAPAVEAPARPPVTEPGPSPFPDGAPATSIKNRVVDAERAARGLGPMEAPLRQKWGTVVDEALRVVSDNPERPRELVRELIAKPRPHTTTEAAVLDIHRVNLHKARAAADADGIAAAARGDADAVEAAKIRAANVSEEFALLDQAGKESGTETARALAFRRAEMAQDYSLLAMETRRRAENDYRPLSPEQTVETKALHDELAKITAERDRLLEIRAKRGAGRVIAGERAQRATSPKSPDYGATNAVVTREAYEKTLAAMRAKMGRLSAGLDPTLLADLAKIGAFHVEAGVRGFGRWAKAMLADAGEEIRPHLRTIWAETQKAMAGTHIKEVTERLRAQMAGGKSMAESPRMIHRLAEEFVRSGVTDRNRLIDAVHEVLRGLDPTITRRDTMDAISGYGVVKPLDKDAAKVELRELKGQMRELAKLEDMAAGKAPLKTGPERQTPGDVQRELIRQVNEAKRQGGYDVRDPESQLRSALDATKTRLKNAIRDLGRQIATKTKDIPNRTKLQLDDEARALKAERDRLWGEYNAIFGKPQMTDEQRVQAAIKATERSVERYEEMLKPGGDLWPKRAPSKTPSDPRLDAVRAQRDALKQRVEEMREALRPKATPEQRALQALKTRKAKRIAELEEQLQNGVREPQPRRRVEMDEEALRLDAREAEVKARWQEALVRDRMARRAPLKKAMDAVFVEAPNFARAVMTSVDVSALGRQGWWLAVTHPILTARALPRMFHSLFSEGALQRSEAEIRSRPSYNTARRSGLFLADHQTMTLSKAEEAFMSRWTQRGAMQEGQPFRNTLRTARNVATSPMRGSQRAYVALLNRVRMDVFDALTATMSRGPKPTPMEAQAIAAYVNIASGRGGPRDSKLLTGLTGILWSPRLLASRFQLLAGAPMYGGSARTRLLIAREYARFLMGMGVIYATSTLFGGETETDPRSADFGKVKVGDARIDPLAGLAQVTTLSSRLLSGETKTLGGQVRDLRGDGVGFGQGDAGDTFERFLRTKLAPIPAAAYDIVSGTNMRNEPTSVPETLRNFLVPISMRDIYEAMQEYGAGKGSALGLLSMLGMGVQIIKDRSAGRSPGRKPSLRDKLRERADR